MVRAAFRGPDGDFLRERGMNDDARDQGEDQSDDAALAARLARGLRLSSELVAGVLVGAVIGWALDHFVGTRPWGLIVFVLLGFVAGVLNVMRSAGLVAEREWRAKK